MLQAFLYAPFGLLLVVVVLHTLLRLVRHFYKFPMPELLAGVIDNPLRREIQPPSEMPLRYNIEAGMTVLEVGPGNGRYTSEIPEPERALREFYRVLKSSGTLACSELLTDPDYFLAQTLIRKARAAKFWLTKRVGNFFAYTLVFEKQRNAAQSLDGADPASCGESSLGSDR